MINSSTSHTILQGIPTTTSITFIFLLVIMEGISLHLCFGHMPLFFYFNFITTLVDLTYTFKLIHVSPIKKVIIPTTLLPLESAVV